MARKSRKHLVNISNENAVESSLNQQSKVFKTAIYTRLSVENSGKDEGSNVIENQIAYCRDYIKDRPDLQLIDVYQDNGITGTTFDRPDFNRLMEDVKMGIVNTIVLRDLSRLGRDYIEIGIYLERIFPELGVRVISINENYDSFAEDKSNEALMIPLQNLINDLYSKDISRKVSTALRTQMKQGTFRASNLPYGYMWNEERDQVVVDGETASYIKMLFQWKIEGMTFDTMIQNLTELNAPNPMYRKTKNGVWYVKNYEPISWNHATIRGILQNERYIGNSILGKTMQAKYKGIYQQVKIERNDCFVIEDTHEAIISKDDFYKVQDIFRQSSEKRHLKIEGNKKIRDKFVDLFVNKIYCGDCGKKMYYLKGKIDKCKVLEPPDKMWRARYHCSSYCRKLNTTCSTHNILENLLHEKVLKAIKTQVKVSLDYEKLLLQLKGSEGEQKVREKQNNAILGLKLRVNNLQKKRSRLYEDFIEGILTDEEYQFTKESFDTEFQILNEMLENMIHRQTAFRNAMSSDNQWIQAMKSVRRAKKLTVEMVDRVVAEVRVYEGLRIEVVMKYDDIYQLMVEGVQELQEVENARSEK